jgi:hypothetical protein
MQITVEQSATLTSATSGSQLRAVVQQKLRAFEDEIQFVVVSVLNRPRQLPMQASRSPVESGHVRGSQLGLFMAKVRVLCLRLKKRFVMFQSA